MQLHKILFSILINKILHVSKKVEWSALLILYVKVYISQENILNILLIHNPLCFCVNQFVKKQGIFHHDLVIISVLEAKCSHKTINYFYGTFYPAKAETCNTINYCSFWD